MEPKMLFLGLTVYCMLTLTNVRASALPDLKHFKHKDSIDLSLLSASHDENVDRESILSYPQLIRHKRADPDSNNTTSLPLETSRPVITKPHPLESSLKWITYLLLAIIVILILLLLILIMFLLYCMLRCKPQETETCREIQVQCCRCDECTTGNGCSPIEKTEQPPVPPPCTVLHITTTTEVLAPAPRKLWVHSGSRQRPIMTKNMEPYIIGIDVGTGSVRGALVTKSGKILKVCTENITTWNPSTDFYEQSSTEIWAACCDVVKNLTKDISSDQVKAIGFDATCSLVVIDADGNPVSVNPNGTDNQNIILWMDHRAKAESDIINETKHPILKFVGRTISLEMMVPKILWLKRNHAECWKRTAHYFLLPDFLTWRATGEYCRSLCSVVCKCNYKSSPEGNSGWQKDFFDSINLKELAEDNWRKIGSTIINPGELCGKLTTKAAKEIGLSAGVPVAASLIDAHAGALGLMGCTADNVSSKFTSRLALISGTSTCHIWQTDEGIHVPGVWGPYYSALLPGLWLLEGGQSASGQLIDYIVENHPAASSIKRNKSNMRLTEYLNELLYKMAKEQGLDSVDKLTEEVHIWPDFHGNRSPIADPTLRGMILGLTLATDEKDLAVLYLATVQALAYGTKHIIEEMERNANNRKIESILICGGLGKNDLFLQTHANAIGLPVLVPVEVESVLLGAAQLAGSVSGFYPNLKETVCNMASSVKQVTTNPSAASYHLKKYQVFLELLKCQQKCNQLMSSHK